MDDIIFDECPRHGNGEPKRLDQLKRRQENRCVYCGTLLPNDRDLLGVACNKQECQGKRWAEFRLTEKQELVFRRNWQAKSEGEIAYEMGHSFKSRALKQHKQKITKKLWIICDRVLLARCYGERLDYVNRRNAHTPSKGTPPTGTTQNGTPGTSSLPKYIPHKSAPRTGTSRKKTA